MITEKNEAFLARFGNLKHFNKFNNTDSTWVRMNLAKNPQLKDHHIDKLVEDDDEDIRCAIAEHPKLKEHHIYTLLDDNDRYVVETVENHPLYKKMKDNDDISW